MNNIKDKFNILIVCAYDYPYDMSAWIYNWFTDNRVEITDSNYLDEIDKDLDDAIYSYKEEDYAALKDVAKRCGCERLIVTADGSIQYPILKEFDNKEQE